VSRKIDLRQIDPLDPLANLTLPVDLTDPQFERFVAHRLDAHFAPRAEVLMHDALDKCRISLEAGCNLLAFRFAQAAAHWRLVMEDYRAGEAVIAAELIEEGR
jgi:hypothetical protein